jgi:hypothetical protein
MGFTSFSMASIESDDEYVDVFDGLVEEMNIDVL